MVDYGGKVKEKVTIMMKERIDQNVELLELDWKKVEGKGIAGACAL